MYLTRRIVQAMKTLHKLLIALAALTLIAAISYMIYRNAQPRPKAAIELNTQTEGSTKQSPVPEATPQPTQTQETPKQLPVQTETTPVVAQAIPNPTPETGGVEISTVVTQSINYETMEGDNKVTYCDLTYNDSTTQRIKAQTIYPSSDGITIKSRYFCSQWIGTNKTKLLAHN